MAVPEAPVHLNDGIPARKHNVGPARQVARVQSKTISQSMKSATQYELGLGVTSPDAAHIELALFW
jgi:hypothetical protein